MTTDYPACFPSKWHYQEWQRVAATAKDTCSICDDCTANYEYRMRLADRCDKKAAKRLFTYPPPLTREAPPTEGERRLQELLRRSAAQLETDQ